MLKTEKKEDSEQLYLYGFYLPLERCWILGRYGMEQYSFLNIGTIKKSEAKVLFPQIIYFWNSFFGNKDFGDPSIEEESLDKIISKFKCLLFFIPLKDDLKDIDEWIRFKIGLRVSSNFFGDFCIQLHAHQRLVIDEMKTTNFCAEIMLLNNWIICEKNEITEEIIEMKNDFKLVSKKLLEFNDQEEKARKIHFFISHDFKKLTYSIKLSTTKDITKGERLSIYPMECYSKIWNDQKYETLKVEKKEEKKK